MACEGPAEPAGGLQSGPCKARAGMCGLAFLSACLFIELGRSAKNICRNEKKFVTLWAF